MDWSAVPDRSRRAGSRIDLDAGREGGDGGAVARSIPLAGEIIDEVIVAYGQNGEPLTPAHGFPSD
jgi:DMSO/TMAO reductase YedYZ molybdopterin-dependent catalytic subunit